MGTEGGCLFTVYEAASPNILLWIWAGCVDWVISFFIAMLLSGAYCGD